MDVGIYSYLSNIRGLPQAEEESGKVWGLSATLQNHFSRCYDDGCEKKINSLRTSWKNAVAKKENSASSGSGANDIQTPILFIG